jgi:hypothetical protein
MSDGPKPMQWFCSICQGPIETLASGYNLGANAQPVNDGRCCRHCDGAIVVPARIRLGAREARAVRYFAVIDGGVGYPVDYYPNEREDCLRAYGDQIVGDFDTADEAATFIVAEFKRRDAHLRDEIAEMRRQPKA